MEIKVSAKIKDKLSGLNIEGSFTGKSSYPLTYEWCKGVVDVVKIKSKKESKRIIMNASHGTINWIEIG